MQFVPLQTFIALSSPSSKTCPLTKCWNQTPSMRKEDTTRSPSMWKEDNKLLRGNLQSELKEEMSGSPWTSFLVRFVQRPQQRRRWGEEQFGNQSSERNMARGLATCAQKGTNCWGVGSQQNCSHLDKNRGQRTPISPSPLLQSPSRHHVTSTSDLGGCRRDCSHSRLKKKGLSKLTK